MKAWKGPLLAWLVMSAILVGIALIPPVAHGRVLKAPAGYPAMSKSRIRAEVMRALIEDKVSPSERRKALWIQGNESVRNLAVSHARRDRNRCYGVWQLDFPKARKCAWYDPHLATHRAVRYMRGRYGSIAAAYRHKRRKGWY